MRWFRRKRSKEPSQPRSESVSCPRCGLTNPATSLWCDCGHVFDMDRAREVVTDELHARVDRPIAGVLFCPLCSRLNPSETQLCLCGYRFRPPPTDTDTIPVKCPSCAARLWLRPPFDGCHFSCPDCSKLFATTLSER